MMKLFLLSAIIIITNSGTSQNIGLGTESPAAKLHVKGSVDASQLIIDANSTQNNTNPLIKLRKSDRSTLMWIHSDDYSNIFIGQNAGRANNRTAGGFANTFIGNDVGYSNTTGDHNTAIGFSALADNTTGDDNAAYGSYALEFNNGGRNTARGKFSLRYNSSGSGNVACGYSTLYNNYSGSYNIAIGESSLYNNTTGWENTAVGASALAANNNHYNIAVGRSALYSTATAQYNVAVGYNAGRFYDNGYNNVFVGANTDVNGIGYFNVIAIGQGTVVGGSSVARFGNAATVSYGGWAGWTNVSDGRFKRNVEENVPGVDFILKLRPVTYQLNATGLDAFYHKNDKAGNGLSVEGSAVHQKALFEKEKITYTGFIAQDVAKAATELGFDFSGVDLPKSENDAFGLRYAEFVVPLVKAVQEQQQIIQQLQKQIDELKKEMQLIKNK